MSIKAMTRVWEHSHQKGSNLLALLALADHADDFGECWPSEDRIAKKIRMSLRQTQRILASLEQKGEIARKLGDGRGNTTHYLILSGFNATQKGDKLASFMKQERVTDLNVKGDILTQERVTKSTPKKRAISKTATKQTTQIARGEPSLEPSLETLPQPANAVAVDQKPVAPKKAKASATNLEVIPIIPKPFPLWKAWVDRVMPEGKAPPGISFTPFSRFFKSLADDGVTAEEVGCAGELMNAWRMALPLPTTSVIKWEVAAVTANVRRAMSLCADNITPDDVTSFVKGRYAEIDRDGKRFWAGKLVTFEHVADSIGSWKSEHKSYQSKVEAEAAEFGLDLKDMIA